MTERKVLRHLVYIGTTLDATCKFSKYLSCPFVPDEVKVKQVCEAGANNYAKVFQIRCSTLSFDGKAPLATYINNVTSFVGVTHTLNKSIDQTHDFSVVDGDGVVIVALAAHQLSILLEFRKYT